MAKRTLTVLTGTETGLIKELSFPSLASRDRQNNLIPKVADEIKLNNIGQVNAEASVQHMTYVHKESKVFDAKSDKLAAARKNGSIDIYHYDEATAAWKAEECLEGFDSAFVHLSSHGQHLFAATASGMLSRIPVFDEEAEVQSWRCDVPHISALAFAPQSDHIFATVGKDQPLTLWDLTKVKATTTDTTTTAEEDPVLVPTFVAKGPPNDKLDLRIEQDLTGVHFTSNSPSVLVTTSRIGHIALYDTRLKRRPVALHHAAKAAILTSAVLNEEHFIFADASGALQLYDIKAGRCLGKYKGSPGVTHAVQVTADKRWVVSTGVDRFVRVHSATTRDLVHSHYIKSKGSALLLDDFSLSAIAEEASALEDATWDDMEVLASGDESEEQEEAPKKTAKKRRL